MTNVVYAASAYPLGKLSDTINRKLMLGVGITVLIFADLTLALASNAWMVCAGTGFR